jgi:hypothetical protein
VRLDKLYVGERIKHLYDTHGLERFYGDQFGADTVARLGRAFRARGVAVESLDNFGPLLDR